MNLQSILNQVLNSVQNNTPVGGRSPSPLNGLGGGMLTAGILSMLMKKKSTKSLAKAGSVAALGMLAYQAYQSWQQNSRPQAAAPAADQFAHNQADGEAHSRVILKTMIAAAASDGLIDAQERAMIEQEAVQYPQEQQWLAQEFNRPASAAEVAAAVGGRPALAAEAYLAARMVCDELSRKEIVFLSQLSQALNLDDQLVDALEKQAGF
ncbi:tellurite resistance TerB family protein [Neisseria leonii]|uniref:tellurite resistance TerB family protein n=1 Tax=Neisseria leonii TaxID=2995413 RepID=UPI00237BBBFC|nr:DUF533 domain-containing protein [Neisseria sp. 3986]MDD9325175.1 DUF533 domain-containing protein [Neisseria sp. 3986]